MPRFKILYPVHFFQELEDGRVVFVESNKLTVRFHTVDPYTIECLKDNLRYQNIDMFKTILIEIFQRSSSVRCCSDRGCVLLVTEEWRG